jgi:hypothetical protein
MVGGNPWVEITRIEGLLRPGKDSSSPVEKELTFGIQLPGGVDAKMGVSEVKLQLG